MPLLEDRCASFIVRVWCENGDAGLGSVRVWRGSIEHVTSGQRAFFQELDAVVAFMKPHLVALGIDEPSRFWERMEARLAAPLPDSPPAVESGRRSNKASRRDR